MNDSLKPGLNEDFSPIELRVYQILREQILVGELKAGERLIERELAERLNISRTPVREALRKLDSEGLIKIIPRKGGIVSELSSEEILDMFLILESLETLAVRQAAERITPDQQRMLQQVDESDVSEMIDAICKVARNRRLEEMLRGLLGMIRATASIGREDPHRATQAVEEHRAILNAVKSGDASLAQTLVQMHVRGSVEAYKRQLKKRELEANRKDGMRV